MRRDMQEVLKRWGRWAAREEYCSLVDWPAWSATPGYAPVSGPSVCSDEDGAAIDACVAHMSLEFSAEDMLILGQRFIGGHSLRQIAEAMGMPRTAVSDSLTASEAYLQGCLAMASVRLDMDPDVRLPERSQSGVVSGQKPVLCF